MSKHILYILPYLEQGGTERQALSLIKHFQQHYRVTLLAPDGKGVSRFNLEKLSHFRFCRLEQNLLTGIRQFRDGLLAIQRSQPIDIVHVHAAHELMLLVKLFLPDVPVVFTVHGYHGAQSQISYYLACRFANWCADAVIAVCKAEYKILTELGLSESRLNLIYNGVDEPQLDADKSHQFAQQFGLDRQTQIIIGTAARLTEAKGLSYLIQAFASLAQTNNTLRLVLAGSGELEPQLKQLAQNLQVQDRVIFAGYVEDLPNLLELFHIFVLPSLQEACSLACVEAMAQKKAAIGTRIGGIAEQITDCETGFIIAAKDSEGLAAKLSALISNRALLELFGNNGYEKYQREFTTDTMLQKTEAIYKSL